MTPPIIVVGGGPAGAVTAGLLARGGCDVIVLDAAGFPRSKPCGESLNPGAVRLLQRFGIVSSVMPFGPVRLSGWRLLQGGAHCDIDFPGALAAWTVDRRHFDYALLQWAARGGARIYDNTKVVDVLTGPGGITGVIAASRNRRHHLPGRLVVGADGLRSVVSRRLGLVLRGPSAPKVALTGHWTGVDRLTGRGELHFCRGAVCGVAPIGARGEANITLVLPVEGRGVVRSWEPLIARLGLTRRFSDANPVAAPMVTGPFDQPVKGLYTPGALLVGDAAGYFDPLTGQGLFRALRTAELAAGAILSDWLPGRSDGPLKLYEQRVRHEFDVALRLQRLIDVVVQRPPLLHIAIRLFERCPGLGRWLLGHVGDCFEVRGAATDADSE